MFSICFFEYNITLDNTTEAGQGDTLFEAFNFLFSFSSYRELGELIKNKMLISSATGWIILQATQKILIQAKKRWK